MISNNLYHAQQKKYCMYDSLYHCGLGDLGWPGRALLIFKKALIYVTLTQIRDDFNAFVELLSTDEIAQIQKWSCLFCLTK